MDKQKKTTVHSLSLPYPEPQWYRAPISKGRARKANNDTKEGSLPTWMPDVYDHLTVGFNSTVRRLESLARSQKPRILVDDADVEQPEPGVNLSVVLVCRENLPHIMTSTLPLLIATSASKPTRAKLVNISAEAEEQIAQALYQRRIGVLGIDVEAVGAEALLHFIQNTIATIDVPWLDQISPPVYHPVKVNTVVTAAKSKPAATGRKRKRLGNG
ncbi:Ribonucleases P/MRP protein subunit [Cladophialophora carrionii]|uniref:Ribonucleases P/MRP protein subunit n=1 Tax=Cladophialophora carrionii TaxID=86049 RepID=A0A1C1CXR0_9EURO|nr:Ribonucleases P/MRP protein subunit [Cladophialophora carrionii]